MVMVKERTTASLNSIKRSIDRSGTFLTEIHGGQLHLIKDFAGQQKRIVLEKTNSNQFSLKIDCPDISHISHYDYSLSGRRLTRNKILIKSIIKFFKKMELWHLIDKTFLFVNKNNKKSDKKKLTEELKYLTDY
jgi:hypothetical protein